MKNKFFLTIIFFISFFLIYSSQVQAKNNKIIDELTIYRQSVNIDKIITKTKSGELSSLKVSTKPKPKKFRSTAAIEFSDLLKLKDNESKAVLMKQENEIIQFWDLDGNGKEDMIIKYSSDGNIIYCQLDLNENGIGDTEYLFNKMERWIYYDTNENGLYDYLFKDFDNDGKEDEIIEITN